jgi:hypothetical protein
MQLEATGTLTVTHAVDQSPTVVHTAELTSEDLDRAIMTLTDPALLEIFFSDTPCCDGFLADYGERLTIEIGERQGTIDYPCICEQASVEAARQEMDRLVEAYVASQ